MKTDPTLILMLLCVLTVYPAVGTPMPMGATLHDVTEIERGGSEVKAALDGENIGHSSSPIGKSGALEAENGMKDLKGTRQPRLERQGSMSGDGFTRWDRQNEERLQDHHSKLPDDHASPTQAPGSEKDVGTAEKADQAENTAKKSSWRDKFKFKIDFSKKPQTDADQAKKWRIWGRITGFFKASDKVKPAEKVAFWKKVTNLFKTEKKLPPEKKPLGNLLGQDFDNLKDARWEWNGMHADDQYDVVNEVLSKAARNKLKLDPDELKVIDEFFQKTLGGEIKGATEAQVRAFWTPLKNFNKVLKQQHTVIPPEPGFGNKVRKAMKMPLSAFTWIKNTSKNIAEGALVKALHALNPAQLAPEVRHEKEIENVEKAWKAKKLGKNPEETFKPFSIHDDFYVQRKKAGELADNASNVKAEKGGGANPSSSEAKTVDSDTKTEHSPDHESGSEGHSRS